MKLNRNYQEHISDTQKRLMDSLAIAKRKLQEVESLPKKEEEPEEKPESPPEGTEDGSQGRKRVKEDKPEPESPKK